MESKSSSVDSRRPSIGGPDLPASGLESNGAALPNEDSSLAEGASSSMSGLSKRHREESPSASRKRNKMSSENFVQSAEGREVLRIALKENIIFAAPDTDAAVGFLAEYIHRIWENLKDTKDVKYPVVIIDAPSAIKHHLQTLIPEFDVVSYDALGSDIPRNKAEILLIDSSSLLEDLTGRSINLNRVGSLVLGRIPSCGDDSSISHPISRIIKNFYTVLDSSSRPLVFAGLFSPASFCSDITFNSLILEATLCCKIHGLTAESRTKCSAQLHSVRESVVFYDAPHSLPTTPLVRQLRSFSSSDSCVQRLLKYYQHALLQLGPCAADLVWGLESEQMGFLSSEVHQLLQSCDLMSPNIDINSPGLNVTPKVLKLVQVLKSCQDFGDDFRGVIFVHRRIVAYTLGQLLLMLDSELGFLRIRVLNGARNLDTLSQVDIFHHLDNGTCNLLIATKSVEDLDIPKVSVIIKFDLFDSQLSHAHVLSHSPEDGGHIISMVERDNSAHSRIVSHLSNRNPRVRVWMNALCRTPQSSFARDIPYTDRDPYFSDSEEESEATSFIRDPTTGSKLYPQDAINAMYLLPVDDVKSSYEERSLYNPLFEFDVQDDGQFICRIKSTAQSQSVPPSWSAPSLTKAGARRLASYDLCVYLYEQGLLASRVFSKLWTVPSENDALPAADTIILGTRVYGKKSPAFWTNSALVSLDSLTRFYAMIISIESGTDSIPSHASILLLTRQPLPDIPTFNVFFAGLPSPVNLTRAEPFTLTERQRQDIHSYNVQLWRGILNKPYSSSSHESLALFAPLDGDWSCKAARSSGSVNVFSHISWALISATVENWIVPLKCDNAETLRTDTKDALIQDRWTHYTRRYDVVEVRSDLNPLSKPLDPGLQEYDNLVEYCRTRRKDFPGLKDYEQPLLEVSPFPSFTDRLAPVAGPSIPTTSKHRYFIPELCAKVTVPASIFRTVLLLPCIMRRVDDFLLVKELNAGLLSHCVSEELLHAALSAPSAGIEYDYERLELLGDAFLKLLSSIYIFVMYPKAEEASMHNYRQAIISNKSLLKNAVAVGLPSFIQSKPFSFKGWHPPRISSRDTSERSMSAKENTASDDKNSGEIKINIQRTGEQQGTHEKKGSQPVQRLGDKALADVVEAIMGAALLTGGTDVALKAAKALNIPLPRIEKWADFGQKAQKFAPEPISVQISSSTIEAIEATVGCQFKRPQFLVQALTHITKTSVQSTTYERLEFIGDAILDFMVVRHVFHRHQQMNPGALSLLKGAMVSNTTLAAVCVSSGLHHHLLFESDKLAHDIREYEYLLKRAQTEEYTLAEQEGRSTGQFWHNIDSPKVLSDLIESILGALYVSDEYFPVGAEAFFDKVFKPFYDRHITLQTLSHHPTKILFELLQSKGCEKFSLVKEYNEYLVLVHDVILASTQDEAGVSGAKVASCIGLYALEGDPGFLARTCDCWKKVKVA
ncbi:hypothetical protein J3R30DRAFT_3689707 [Lentinula aciculospora]|uniref:RNase III domain-containing protein n=1 Tax=Lentinula aciculospora TaxID=153920 RepID=A0A9W8ZTG3_9AGAR|nr:hypothetical protein J3R30DRAFT_3689707 [Lentinula aciculospora]